jgi:hypothetical protein
MWKWTFCTKPSNCGNTLKQFQPNEKGNLFRGTGNDSWTLTLPLIYCKKATPIKLDLMIRRDEDPGILQPKRSGSTLRFKEPQVKSKLIPGKKWAIRSQTPIYYNFWVSIEVVSLKKKFYMTASADAVIKTTFVREEVKLQEMKVCSSSTKRWLARLESRRA